MAAVLTRRPTTAADREFLCALYASTRVDELAQVDWPAATKQAFLRSQFDLQCEHYDKHYAQAERSIIERAGEPIGRLYVYRGDPVDVRIVDVALVPAARGAGIGAQLITEELASAARLGKTVSIHVERFNPALRLYRRLGFEHTGEHGVYFLMRWSGPAGDEVAG